MKMPPPDPPEPEPVAMGLLAASVPSIRTFSRASIRISPPPRPP
jgi:hypothetical protein